MNKILSVTSTHKTCPKCGHMSGPFALHCNQCRYEYKEEVYSQIKEALADIKSVLRFSVAVSLLVSAMLCTSLLIKGLKNAGAIDLLCPMFLLSMIIIVIKHTKQNCKTIQELANPANEENNND